MRRTVIVGDIHGCFDELTELLDTVGLHPDDLLVSVGDIVDRGPAPTEVVQFFRERPNSLVVMGNHERKHAHGTLSYAQQITRLQMGDHYAEAVDWLRTLPYYFENEHVRVVHAAMVPGLELPEQQEEILCGMPDGRRQLKTVFPDSAWYAHYTDTKPVAFGHVVMGRAPMVRDGRVFGLDTGACHGGTLTALSVPDFTVHSVAAHTDYWSHARIQWQLPVLRSWAWQEFTWAELDSKIEHFATSPDTDVRDWLERVQRWASGLRASFPRLTTAAYRLTDVLDTDAARDHPASWVLLRARDGRLTPTTLAEQCPTPGATIEVATALGVDTGEPPD